MKSIYLLFTLLLQCAIVCAQDYSQAIEKARFLITNHQQQTNIPGIQVAVFADDSLIWSEAFGHSNLSEQKPLTKNTQFRIASVSKPVTAVALAKMMEQGEIDIDKAIRYYLPEFPEKEFPITARQLAASTSGIRHYQAKDLRYNTTNYASVIASLEKFKDDPLLFEPGTGYHYSSYGWVLLSAVMEKAKGLAFDQIMQETWDDLGMKNTAFDEPNKQSDIKSTFYIYDKKEGRVEAPKDNRSYMYAGGGYLSTAEDLAKMGNNLLNGNYLKQETVSTLFQSQQLKDGSNTFYGLGWETGESRLSTPIVYHGGSMSSARSHLVLYPEENIVFAYVSNTGDRVFFNDREAQCISELFVYEKRESQQKEPFDLSGTWKVNTTSLRNKKSKGSLSLSRTKDGVLTGELTFKRSRKKKSFPIVLADIANDTIHLVGVSLMSFDVYLTGNDKKLKGYWLHDFNVKGIPEEDEYWNAREIACEKVK